MTLINGQGAVSVWTGTLFIQKRNYEMYRAVLNVMFSHWKLQLKFERDVLSFFTMSSPLKKFTLKLNPRIWIKWFIRLNEFFSFFKFNQLSLIFSNIILRLMLVWEWRRVDGAASECRYIRSFPWQRLKSFTITVLKLKCVFFFVIVDMWM